MDLIMDFLAHDSVAPAAISNLLDLCFGPARHRRTAALLRTGAPRIEQACFVALDGETLVGSVEVHLLEWRHPRASRPMAMLGPLVSHPARRGERIGTRLMDLALAEVDKRALPVMLLGDAPYYGRWGFSARHTEAWTLPGQFEPDRLLLRACDGHRLRGPASLSAPGRAVAAA